MNIHKNQRKIIISCFSKEKKTHFPIVIHKLLHVTANTEYKTQNMSKINDKT